MMQHPLTVVTINVATMLQGVVIQSACSLKQGFCRRRRHFECRYHAIITTEPSAPPVTFLTPVPLSLPKADQRFDGRQSFPLRLVPLETQCLPKSAQLRPPAHLLRCSPPNQSSALIAQALRPSTRPATSTQLQIHSVIYLIGSLAIPLIILLSLLLSSGVASSLPG